MKKAFILITSGILISLTSLTLADYGLKTIIYEKNNIESEQKNIYIDEMSLALTKTQISIGFNKYNLVPSSQALAILQRLEHLARINIISSLDLSVDRDITLHEYLQESNKAILEGEMIILSLRQELILLKDGIESCLTEKLITDKNYFLYIKEYNTQGSNIAMEQSKKHAQCASDKRIEFNAMAEIYDRLNYYYEILSKKFDYLSIKESHIIQSFDTIKNDIIQELNNKMLLNNL